MNKNLHIETRGRRLIFYLEDIEKGLLLIPSFQRDDVWDNNARIDLLDSLKKGYPIGSILLWRPEDNFFKGSLNKIGSYTIDRKDENNALFILDGFQRLSTLFGCLTNPDKTKLSVDKEEWRKKFFICYDLEREEFFMPRTGKLEFFQIPVYNLIDTRAAYALERELQKIYPEDKIDKYLDSYKKLGTTLLDYTLSSIEITGGGIEDAVEIYSRLNSKGSIISPDWMVSILTYNEGFRLGSVIDNLIEELKEYNFDKIRRDILFKCIINSFGTTFFDQSSKTIEKLATRSDFIPTTKKTIENIKKAVQFLFEELLVVDSKLLPYGNQLIFITDFFNQIEAPTLEQKNKLKQWFWVTTYASYFTIYSLSKQREAYKQFQKFLKNEIEDSIYNDKPDLMFDVTDFPNKIHFGSVRAKAFVLFMLNYSNDFKIVDAKEVEGLDLNYLFYDIKDDKGNFYPESVIAVIDTLQAKFPKSRDMSFMLKKYKEEYKMYFLTKEMTEIKDKLDVLAKRKELITNEEKAFVEKLGLNYVV